MLRLRGRAWQCTSHSDFSQAAAAHAVAHALTAVCVSTAGPGDGTVFAFPIQGHVLPG